jgi:hypothetical protein
MKSIMIAFAALLASCASAPMTAEVDQEIVLCPAQAPCVIGALGNALCEAMCDGPAICSAQFRGCIVSGPGADPHCGDSTFGICKATGPTP